MKSGTIFATAAVAAIAVGGAALYFKTKKGGCSSKLEEGKTFYSDGEYDKALEKFSQIPATRSIKFNIALCHLKKDDFEKCFEICDELVAEENCAIDVFEMAAEACKMARDSEKGTFYIGKFFEQFADDTDKCDMFKSRFPEFVPEDIEILSEGLDRLKTVPSVLLYNKEDADEERIQGWWNTEAMGTKIEFNFNKGVVRSFCMGNCTQVGKYGVDSSKDPKWWDMNVVDLGAGQQIKMKYIYEFAEDGTIRLAGPVPNPNTQELDRRTAFDDERAVLVLKKGRHVVKLSEKVAELPLKDRVMICLEEVLALVKVNQKNFEGRGQPTSEEEMAKLFEMTMKFQANIHGVCEKYGINPMKMMMGDFGEELQGDSDVMSRFMELQAMMNE